MTLVPSSTPLTNFTLLTFDIYGTLIDQETGLSTALLRSSHLSTLAPTHPYKTSRSTLLRAFAAHERAIQSAHPTMLYRDILASTYKRIVQDLVAHNEPQVDEEGLEEAAQDFGRSVASWPAFPDTVDALKRLGKRYKLAPLSNIDRESLAGTLANGLDGAGFAATYTAQDIGSYKPDLRNFEYLFKHAGDDFPGLFGFEDEGEGEGEEVRREKVKGRILHVAQSLWHDHVPAAQLGLESVWVDRGGVLGSKLEGEVVEKARFGWKVGSLKELADIVEEAWAKEGK